jgi:hypothetical protein
MSVFRNFNKLRRLMVAPIRVASESASSIRPARIKRFFRRSCALISGVTKSGSVDVTVMLRSG